MADATNETTDWTKRTNEENDALFANEDDFEEWKPFNIFTNGKELASGHPTANSNRVKYKSSFISSANVGLGTTTSKEGALSTLSMYNYLSSKFDDNGIIIYSNKRTSNMPNKYSHHSVNMIGSGILGTLYYANTLVVMLIAALISVIYCLTTLFSVLKKGLSLLYAIPGATIGILKSIVAMVTTTVVMCGEIIIVIFLYLCSVKLLMMLVVGISRLLVSENVVPSNTTILQGIFLSQRVPAGLITKSYVYGSLLVTTLFLVGILCSLWYYKRAWVVSVDKVTDVVIGRVFESYDIETVDITVRNPVRICMCKIALFVTNVFNYLRFSEDVNYGRT